MALQEYRRKRHPERTSEPEGQLARSASGHLYVIQKHAATHLHYDFRLELDGVLKSWAVPKGPSLIPDERRLAVHVEDHPVAYGSFEGIIPPGEYGGGTVMLWDRGEWEPVGNPRAGYRRGRLRFRLHGQKLRGGWTLVRMGGAGQRENWLLIKERDPEARAAGEREITEEKQLSVASRRTMAQIAAAEDRVWSSDGHEAKASQTSKRPPGKIAAAAGSKRSTARKRPRSIDPSELTRARKAPQPEQLSPQLATLVDSAPTGDQWLHEVKFDGYRIVAIIANGQVRLMTRRGQDWTARFPAIARAVAGLPVRQAILDGELVALRADGRPDFQTMQNALRGGRAVNLVYYLFDLPYCEDYRLTQTPLLERKELLRRVLEGQPEESPLRYSDHIVGEGREVLQNACRMAMEGLICKRSDSPYESARSPNWVKVKCLKRQEFVVGGYTPPGGSRQGFGALLLGYYDDQGRLRYAGKVGTGFNAQALAQIRQTLHAIETDRPAFKNPPRARDIHWVRPERVAEVEFTEWTHDGRLRHPSFQGFREDKSPQDVVREEPEPAPAGGVARRRIHQRARTKANAPAQIGSRGGIDHLRRADRRCGPDSPRSRAVP